MTQHTFRLCKGYLTKKESDGVLQQITWPPQSPDLNPIEMVWDKLDGKVKEKQPTNAQHMWELLQDCLEKHSRWSWLRECQECATLSLRQRVATLKNLKCKIYFELFNTFLVTTWFHMCYSIVLMFSLLFYNVVGVSNLLTGSVYIIIFVWTGGAQHRWGSTQVGLNTGGALRYLPWMTGRHWCY